MPLFHVFDLVDNRRTGIPMEGVQVRAKFDDTDTIAPIYADQDGAAFVPANYCVTDADGMFSFYIDSGEYALEFLVGDAVLKTIPDFRPAEVGPSGPANSTYNTTAELESADVSYISAILAETGKAGTFTTRDYVDFTAQVAADSGKINYIRSIFDPTKVWVRTSILSDAASQTGASSGVTVDAELTAKATLTGVGRTATDLGAFTGSSIPDNQAIKGALQALETAVENTSGNAATKANATALGVAATDANMGTFTGAIIPDNQTAKQALQALETATDSVNTTVGAKSQAAAMGVSAADNDLGTFTGTTIADSSSAKSALQALETSLEDNSYPAATAAISLPYYNFRTQKRNLADFIDKAQWANCRAGTPTVATTNGLGQDALAAATADMEGAVGGEIQVPDGYFRVAAPTITQDNFTLHGNARSSVMQSTSATEDFLTIAAVRATIADLTFVSTQVRTAGAYLKVALAGQRFDCENLTAFGAFTLLQIEGDPNDPAIQGGVYNASKLLAEGTVQNGLPFVINGGYLVTLDNLRQIGDGAASALLGPAAGLLVTRCADLEVTGNSQFINCQRGLDVRPATGAAVNSLALSQGYFGTSYYGSRITGGDGGSVGSVEANGVWFGENKDAGGGAVGSGPGLSIIGAAAGRIKQVDLIGCNFPLCQGDGLNVDQYARSVNVLGGWADGSLGSGYAFNGTQEFSLIGARSGGERFGGNGFSYFIDAASDYFRVSLNSFNGNGGAGTNGAGTGPTKVFANNIGS